MKGTSLTWHAGRRRIFTLLPLLFALAVQTVVAHPTAGMLTASGRPIPAHLLPGGSRIPRAVTTPTRPLASSPLEAPPLPAVPTRLEATPLPAVPTRLEAPPRLPVAELDTPDLDSLEVSWQETALEEARPDDASRAWTVLTYGTLQWGIQYAMLVVSAPENWKHYGNTLNPSWDKFTSNFTRAPVFEPVEFGGGGFLGVLQADGDPWPTNVIGHGLQGSEIYLRMRRNGYNAWQSFLGGVAHSTLWEYGIEGLNETPSAVDLIYTPLSGALIGEGRYQLIRLLDRQPDHWWVKPVRFVVDPVAAIVEAAD